jgi:hypothetical protein
MKWRTLSYFSTLLRGNMKFIPVYIPVWNKNGKKVPVKVILVARQKRSLTIHKRRSK